VDEELTHLTMTLPQNLLGQIPGQSESEIAFVWKDLRHHES